ncbi:MAG: hypothetical protein NTY16_06595 [Deltaproteobacteria bacterium]|nr:hypothetical protein [Deltaproteobacteria bacterium]
MRNKLDTQRNVGYDLSMENKNTIKPSTSRKMVSSLSVGDVVIGEMGSRRVVVSAPQRCRAAGYFYVRTDGAPVNTWGGNLVTVEK